MTMRQTTTDTTKPADGGLDLAGMQKAAILLVAVGETRAAEILSRLSPDEAETLATQLAMIPRSDSDAVRAVLQEAVDGVLADQHLAEGGLEYARNALQRSLGTARANEILGRLESRLQQRPFRFLNHTAPEHIAMFIRAESAQTRVLVISNLHPTLAANVLSALEPADQAEIARRIATLGNVPPAVPRVVEEVRRQRFISVIAQRSAAVGGTKTVAEILASAGTPTERHVLEHMAEHDALLAEEIRALLFTFEDIIKLDDRSIQTVLREIDQNDLALALRGAGHDVHQRIFSNMSERGAELLREELEFQPRQRRRLVEEAQGCIVGVIRRLEDTDAIAIGGSGDDTLV